MTNGESRGGGYVLKYFYRVFRVKVMGFIGRLNVSGGLVRRDSRPRDNAMKETYAGGRTFFNVTRVNGGLVRVFLVRVEYPTFRKVRFVNGSILVGVSTVRR